MAYKNSLPSLFKINILLSLIIQYTHGAAAEFGDFYKWLNDPTDGFNIANVKSLMTCENKDLAEKTMPIKLAKMSDGTWGMVKFNTDVKCELVYPLERIAYEWDKYNDLTFATQAALTTLKDTTMPALIDEKIASFKGTDESSELAKFVKNKLDAYETTVSNLADIQINAFKGDPLTQILQTRFDLFTKEDGKLAEIIQAAIDEFRKPDGILETQLAEAIAA